MNASEIARELGGASQATKGWWSAKCPVHADGHASLGLRDTDDGCVAWKCNAGCDKAAVGEALRARGLLPAPEARGRSTTPRRRIVAVYDYRDAAGGLVFQVVRYAPKDFRQRRPNPTKPDDFIWSIGDLIRPLYGLPALLAADEAVPVFLVEGEKDVDRLRSIGILATTTAQGAKGWSTSDHSPLAGRAVVILPDNDTPGRGYAEQAARDLVDKAASLKVLELPDLPPKGDVSDWLDAGGTAEMLRRLAAEAPTSELPTSAGRTAHASAGGYDHHLDELARLTGIEYDLAREAKAKELGIRKSTLDKAVAEKREDAPEPGIGRALEWPEADPWPEQVYGHDLLVELATTYRRFVVLPPACDTALALWTLHAHAFEASPITPRLAITSPEKRCGKTTTLEVVQALVPRPILASSITAAAVFRTIELARPTLLIDEADTFLSEAEELRGVLNSGHRRSGEVIRTAGEDHEPRRFSTWAPVAIAAIGKIPGTLDDRSIKVELRRRGAGEQIERWRLDRAHQLESVARRCARWAADHHDDLRTADPGVPAQLHDRAADNWRCLLAIADLVGGEWPARARAAAVTLSAGAATEGRREMLLADVRAVFVERDNPEWIATAEIIKALVEMAERPWGEHSRGKPITAQGLRSALEPFKVFSTQRQKDGDRNRGYLLASFADAWARYLPADASVHPCADQQTSGFQPNLYPCTPETSARMQNGPKSSNGATNARMHGSKAPSGPGDIELRI